MNMMKKYLIIGIYLFCLIGSSHSQQKTVDQKIDSLLSIMTLDEKIGQLNQFAGTMNPTGPITRYGDGSDAIQKGQVGSVLNVVGAKRTREVQRMAVENTRLGIPLLIGFDVIHGYRTLFPIPLAEAASWDMDLMKRTAQAAADEASATGIHWTFAPMVDICRDARWGRVMEGAGEDPYYTSLVAKVKVEGYQGDDLSNLNTVIACAKHFAGYGGAEAGRDYNIADMSDAVLRNIYLPPFKAAVESGVGTFMSGFHELNGVPTSANQYLLQDILRNEWQFNGFVVSDWGSIKEVATHGYTEDLKGAAFKSFFAGVDMDMESTAYLSHLKSLVLEGKISKKAIDNSVGKILRMKYAVGIMDDPYRYCDEEREKNTILKKEYIALAKEAACKSMVLLKNEGNILPLSEKIKSVAIIGPLANSKKDMLGDWSASGDPENVVTLLETINEQYGKNIRIEYIKGCDVDSDDRSGFEAAIKAAEACDVIIAAMGESKEMSGEASSRGDITLPGVQEELLKQLQQTGKAMVLVLFNGRPLAIPWAKENIPTILEAWFPGIQAGPALTDVLFGKFNPQGKLTITFPYATGQVPVFYNHKRTGKPMQHADDIYASRYLDLPVKPLFPFGYGLSYTTFQYSEMNLDKKEITKNSKLTASVTVKNTGKFTGKETVQLYICDLVASVTRPVKELKGFKQINLQVGETQTVSFEISENDLRFWNEKKEYISEPGKFRLFIGTNSDEGIEADFELKN
jgi:beta-glucosidase